MVGTKLGIEHATGSHSGAWIREQGRSDMSAYSKQLDLLNVKGLKKYTALHLFKERRLHADTGGMTISIAAPGVPFTVTECYKWSKKTAMKRRDGQPGHQHGAIGMTTDGLRVEACWGPPNPGKFVELYMLENEDTLVVRSVMEVNGTEVPGMLVYKRT